MNINFGKSILPWLLAVAVGLVGCSAERDRARNTPFQPGTQASGEPDFVLLWNAGPETARLSDELAAFVGWAFYGAIGFRSAAPPTSGVLQQGPGGSFTWQPGIPGGKFEVRTNSGRVIRMTIHSASSGWWNTGSGPAHTYRPRESHSIGLGFDVEIEEDGVLDVRLTQDWLPLSDARLAAAQSVYNQTYPQVGFDRSLTGDVWYRGRTWAVNATHRGIDDFAPHVARCGESLELTMEGGGEQLTASCLIGLFGHENFYAPYGNGGIHWSLEQQVVHVTGGTSWSVSSGSLRGALSHEAGYRPLLTGGGWPISGDILRNGSKVGRFAYRALVQPETAGEPVVAMQGGAFEVVQPAGRPAPVSLFDDPFIED